MDNNYPSLLLAVALAIASPSLANAYGVWDTDDNQPYTYTCASGHFLSSVISVNTTTAGWTIQLSCRALPIDGTLEKCDWSSYTYGYDEAFQCPYSGYIAGLSSYCDSGVKDRRFRFYCCRLRYTYALNCTYNTLHNFFDLFYFNWIPLDKTLTGMMSYHDNDSEGLQFQFRICDLRKLNSNYILPA